MKLLRAALACCTSAIVACVPTTRSVVLHSDARLLGGTETYVRAEVPGYWSESVSRPDRAELLGSDNFTRMTLTVVPVTADPARCPEFARRAAEEVPAPRGTRKLNTTPPP